MPGRVQWLHTQLTYKLNEHIQTNCNTTCCNTNRKHLFFTSIPEVLVSWPSAKENMREVNSWDFLGESGKASKMTFVFFLINSGRTEENQLKCVWGDLAGTSLLAEKGTWVWEQDYQRASAAGKPGAWSPREGTGGLGEVVYQNQPVLDRRVGCSPVRNFVCCRCHAGD